MAQLLFQSFFGVLYLGSTSQYGTTISKLDIIYMASKDNSVRLNYSTSSPLTLLPALASLRVRRLVLVLLVSCLFPRNRNFQPIFDSKRCDLISSHEKGNSTLSVAATVRVSQLDISSNFGLQV